MSQKEELLNRIRKHTLQTFEMPDLQMETLTYADNLSACSLCLSCSNVCPAKVDLGEQIYRWRQQLDSLGKANPTKKLMSQGMKYLMERPPLFNTALKLAPVVNHLPRPLIYHALNAWGQGREMPRFAKQSFNEMWKKNQLQK